MRQHASGRNTSSVTGCGGGIQSRPLVKNCRRSELSPRRPQFRAVITARRERAVLKRQQLHKPPPVEQGIGRPTFGYEARGVDEPEFMDMQVRERMELARRFLGVSLALKKAPAPSQAAGCVYGPGSGRASTVWSSAPSQLRRRFFGMFLRPMKQLPGPPGRCMLWRVTSRSRGPFLALWQTVTT
jgi:hypothetical protein